LPEPLVRPLVIELVLEGVEVALLRRAGSPHGLHRLPLERAVHAFVRAVLLRAPRPDTLMGDAETHPPDVEIRQAVDRLRRERHPVVGAYGDRETILAESTLEDRPRLDRLRREDTATGEQEAGVLIGDGQRIAVATIARRELPPESCRPEIVRGCCRGSHHAGMPGGPALAALVDQASSGEQVRHGAGGGPLPDAVMLPRQDHQQVASAPVGMRDARSHEELHEVGGDLVRALVRRPAAVLQAAVSLGVVPRQPLVADAPTDPIASTELAHRKAIAEGIAHKLQSLVHDSTLLPRHRRASQARVSSCRLVRVLPMFPDYSVTHAPGLYPRAPNDACCCRADQTSAEREASFGPLATEADVRLC